MLQKTTALGAGGGCSIPGGTRILPSRINIRDPEGEISAYLVSNIDTPEFIADFRLFPENYEIDRYAGDGYEVQLGKYELDQVYFGGKTPFIGCTNPKNSVEIVGYGNKHLNIIRHTVNHLEPPKNAVYAYICACKPTDEDYTEAKKSGFDPENIYIIGTSSWHYYTGKESLNKQTIIPICIASQGGFNYKKGLRGNIGVQLYVFYKPDNSGWTEKIFNKPTKITITSHYYPMAVMFVYNSEDNDIKMLPEDDVADH